ncbi:hypothetical protein PspLS_11001 [Pyricularia sp. CBS 133598]|nr:hypothetical protein PspLS_11001 [Pyricularia sp. CBS 133598]
MDLFADAITNRIRLDGPEWQMNLGKTSDGGAVVRGEGWETAICTVPSWRWLIFPLTIVFLTITLLMGAIFGAWREPELPVWRSNVLPLIFYGLREEAADTDKEPPLDPREKRQDQLLILKRMKETAKDLLIGFDPRHRPGFVINSDTPELVRRRRPYAQNSVLHVDSLLQHEDDDTNP